MDSTQLLKGVLDLAVLAVLHEQDGYGYDILRRLRAAGLDDVGDASVYGTLRRLFQAGSLTTYVVPSEEGPHRKYYSLNKAGRVQLELSSKVWAEFARSMNGLLEKKVAA
jgi:PadR family transcriptional regulator PadR